MGYSLCFLAGGQLSEHLRHAEPGLFTILYAVFGFPMGLTLCVINGASLFTSNIAYMTTCSLERRIKLWRVFAVLACSYICNLLGTLLFGQLMIWGDVFTGKTAIISEIATKKTSLGFGTAFVRGILCNWLVCLAVWQATAAQDVTGKAVGIWLPISGFVAMGFEHCIANMYGLILALRVTSVNITLGQVIVNNLIPVTIGNIVGGAMFVSLPYAMVYGNLITDLKKWISTFPLCGAHPDGALTAR